MSIKSTQIIALRPNSRHDSSVNLIITSINWLFFLKRLVTKFSFILKVTNCKSFFKSTGMAKSITMKNPNCWKRIKEIPKKSNFHFILNSMQPRVAQFPSINYASLAHKKRTFFRENWEDKKLSPIREKNVSAAESCQMLTIFLHSEI